MLNLKKQINDFFNEVKELGAQIVESPKLVSGSLESWIETDGLSEEEKSETLSYIESCKPDDSFFDDVSCRYFYVADVTLKTVLHLNLEYGFDDELCIRACFELKYLHIESEVCEEITETEYFALLAEYYSSEEKVIFGDSPIIQEWMDEGYYLDTL